MYLYAEWFVYDRSHQSAQSETVLSAFPASVSDVGALYSVKLNVGQWRKAYVIHSWFVKHVQDGHDDCDVYEVDREQLQHLLTKIETVLDSSEGEGCNAEKAAELLPIPVADEEYDENYLTELRHTQRILQAALSDVMNGWYFTYTSSW